MNDFVLARVGVGPFHRAVMQVGIPSQRRGHAGHRMARWAMPVLGVMAVAAGCTTPAPKKERDYDPVIARFFLEAPAAMPTAVPMVMPHSGVDVTVAPRPALNESDIANVELVQVDLGLCLLFEFRGDAAKGLFRLTAGNLGRKLVVTFNGKPFGARVIDGAINDGRLYMFIEMRDEELRATALNLKQTTAEIQAALARREKR